MPQPPYRALGILLPYFIPGRSGKFKSAPCGYLGYRPLQIPLIDYFHWTICPDVFILDLLRIPLRSWLFAKADLC